MPDPIVVRRPQPTPPSSSYWVGATRAELAAAIAGRRHQMAPATERDAVFDPAGQATADLARRRILRRLMAGR